MANIESGYTQQTWVSGATPLSADNLNNIDTGLTWFQSDGFFRNGTNLNANKTIASDGYNYAIFGNITVDNAVTLNVQGNLRIL